MQYQSNDLPNLSGGATTVPFNNNDSWTCKDLVRTHKWVKSIGKNYWESSVTVGGGGVSVSVWLYIHCSTSRNHLIG